MDTVGGAFRGMLGVQNKEEAVNAILEGADYDTPEGRRTALEKIRAIDPEAYYKYSKMNQEYETQELGLQEKRNKPQLETEWRLDVGKNVTSNWANSFLGLPGVTTRSDIVKFLNGQVQSKAITSGARSQSLKDYDKFMKEKKSAYLTTNKYSGQSDKTGTVSSKDLFGALDKGGKVSPLEGLDVPSLQAKQESLLQELKSLGEVAQQAYIAKPEATTAINEARDKRQRELHKLITEIEGRIEKQGQASYLKDASSIFSTNAAKFK
jgi:predicted RNase H-related nuclease YkuK (DUF458 family)